MDSGLFIAIGLVLQTAALVLLFRSLKSHWVTRIGAVFIVLAVAYHGLNEILLWLFPNRDPYRLLVSSDYVAQFVLWISVAILLLTVAYLGISRAAESRTVTADWRLEDIRRVYDWRLLLIAAAPLMLLTLAGNGYTAGAVLGGGPLGIDQGLASQFFLLVMPLAGFGIVARFGRRLFLPVLLVQSAAMAVIAQRSAALIAAALLLYALTRVGISIRRSQLAVAVIAFVFVALVITSARGTEGRFETRAGGSVRLDYLAAGIANLVSSTTWDQLAGDLGYRLDGNSFGAMELEAFGRWGQPVLGPRPLLNDLLLAVPSFLNPDKTSASVENRSQKEYAETNLGMPLRLISPSAHQDILPTQLGAIAGFAGPWGLLLCAVLLGAAFAIADWWLRRLTPSRLLVGVGLLTCVLSYEGSWDAYSITFRGILLLLPLLWMFQSGRTRREAPRSLMDQRGRPKRGQRALLEF